MASKDGEDFQLQLELEEKEKRLKESSTTDDPYTYVDADGTTYEWDQQKQAWFPKIDDNFIAAYQSNYGYVDSDDTAASKNTAEKVNEETSEIRPAKRPANDPQGWFEVADEHNTNVYVSNLPLDVTDDEFIEMMSKFGLIMKDPGTNKLKIKLYRDRSGELKGDGLCCFIKVESVELALKILDGSFLRDKEIHVERAKFEQKGQYDPAKKPKKMKSKEKKKLKQQQEKLLDWRPDILPGMRFKSDSTVIIKNMFNPDDFKKQPELILEYQSDLREECSKFGQVKKTVIYDHHPEGVASVSFKEPEEADACILALNLRWFGGRQLTAETWDGKTKYRVGESITEEAERLDEWEKFIAEDATPSNTNT